MDQHTIPTSVLAVLVTAGIVAFIVPFAFTAGYLVHLLLQTTGWVL